MKKLNPDVQLLIEGLPKKELEKLVSRVASKDTIFHDYLLVNYAENGEQELFETIKEEFDYFYTAKYQRLETGLAACHKRIINFSKVRKQKKLELDLVIYALEKPFSRSNSFSKYSQQFNHRIALLVNRAIGLLEKLHEDFRVDYVDTINEQLKVIHCSYHSKYVLRMPKEI